MKPAILAYIPPPEIPGSAQFLANLQAWKTKYPLVLFSDHDYGPGFKLMKASPEFIKDSTYSNGAANKWALNNLIFLTGVMRMFGDTDFTHVLYLEMDCRVNGDNWDAIVFDEFKLRNPDAIAAGTLATYNLHNRNLAFSRCAHTFIGENVKAQFPITGYGGNGAAESHEPAIFPNGALGIYDIAWLKKQFGTTNTVQTASEITAFDYEIGRRLVREFGNDVFRKVLHLNSVYSSYGDVQTSEGERQEFLTSKAVVAVHQIKSAWPGPMGEEVRDIEMVQIQPPDPSVVEMLEKFKSPESFLETKESLRKTIFPKVEILIVSYAPDIPYLRYNLKSIEKFCTGFSGVTLLVPKQHKKEFDALFEEILGQRHWNSNKIGIATYFAPTDKTKWHIAHQLQKCYADKWCPEADYILHTDSDCVFTKPTTPADFFRDGKPILCIEPFARIGASPQVAGNSPWKPVIDAALKIDSQYETMRRHGAIHAREFYKAFRDYMTNIHGEKIDAWWMKQKADYPWGISEFNALGNFALLMEYPYAFIDVSKEHPPESPIFQFWSHRGPDMEQNFPSGGKGVPIEKLRELGLVEA